jgi:hypothetical protein
MERNALSRAMRRSYAFAIACFGLLGVSLTSELMRLLAASPHEDAAFLAPWLATTVSVFCALGLSGNVLRRMLLRRRRKVLDDVIEHSVSNDELKKWFDVPLTDGPWWKVWQSSRRAAIEWLHKQVATARVRQLPTHAAFEVSG